MRLFSKKNKNKHIIFNCLGLKFSFKEKEKLPISDSLLDKPKTILYKYFVQPFILFKNMKKEYRLLEIGPGDKRLNNFEGLNIVKNPATDYIADVANGIPLPNESFDLIYSSYFLEHIEWYKTKAVLQEVFRVLKWGGVLELWVPDGLKIAKSFCDAELYGDETFKQDGWWRFNDLHDPCVWANGRIFTYGNGRFIKGHWNSHLAIFSERYLKSLLVDVGFKNIETMASDMYRGNGHKFINLGLRAKKG